MIARSVAATDVGRQRRNNEDAYYQSDTSGVFGVADGMGGHAAGDVASRLAVETIPTYFPPRANPHARDPRPQLTRLFEAANQRILADSSRNTHRAGMGTTFTVGVVQDYMLFVGHAGDSACFHLRPARAGGPPTVERVTPAQSIGHVLENALGVHTRVFRGAECSARRLQSGDVVLFVTDGFTCYADNDQISLLAHRGPFPAFADRCVQHAVACGGRDNVTAVAVHVK